MNILAILGYLLGAVFVGISAAANARYGVTQGHDDFDKALYFLSAVGVDGLKVLIPILGLMCYRKGNTRWAWVCGALWVGSVAWSLSGAVGWSATSRSTVAGEKASAVNTYMTAKAKVVKLQLDISQLPQHRPLRTIEAAIDADDTPREVMRATKNCTTFKRTADREACQGVLNLRTELATARDAVDLAGKLEVAEAVLAGIKPTSEEADPQAEALAKMMPWLGSDAATFRKRLSLLLALLVEAASALIFTITLIATSTTVAEVATAAVAGVKEAVAEPATRALPPPSRGGDVAEPDTYSVAGVVAGLRGGGVAGKKLGTSEGYSVAGLRHKSPATDPRHTPATEVVAELRHTPATTSATRKWRTPPLDAVELWAAHRLDVAPTASTKASEAYDDFVDWCAGEGMPPLTNQQFGMQVKPIIARLGGKHRKARDFRFYDGVALNSKDNA